MSELLPVGSVVEVVEPALIYRDKDWWGNEVTEVGVERRYRGRVEGYDLHGTKYHLSRLLGGDLWSQPGEWAFPSWCTPVEDAP